MKLQEHFLLILRLAARNLWLYRLRTTIIGGLLAFGAFLAVLGLSLLRDVEHSMRSSITGSIVGDAQIYSNAAKDDLAVFGGGFMGRVDIGSIPDFAPVRAAAMKVANVEAVLPMGLDMALLGRGNELDETLDALRSALKAGEAQIIEDRVGQLRFQLSQLKLEVAEQSKLAYDKGESDAHAAAIAEAEAPGFLDELKTLDEAKLQFLETKIAPISGEKQPIYINYVGTDVPLFQANFPKFRIVEGETLPASRRGILISKKFREDMLKNLVARLLDRLNKRITRSSIKIEGDAENTRIAQDLPRQYQQVMAYLDRGEAETLSAELTAFGIPGAGEAELLPRLTTQVKAFLTIDDANFSVRYTWFYEHVAPHLKLYEISTGETISVRSYTRSGYVKTVPLKVFGIYTFDGLEDSDLAGAMNMMDLVSFRELYGQMNESSRKELETMRSEIGIKEVAQANVEDELFGSAAPEPAAKAPPKAGDATDAKISVRPVIPDRFDADEITSGLALNAAVRLKDPNILDQTIDDVKVELKQAGFDLRVIDWQTAAGIAGQFVVIVRMALLFSLGVIFLVALVIINNSIVVGTLNRTREIGTMRAIGAQKAIVIGLFLGETAITGFFGALLGSAGAAIVLGILSVKGIPAPTDVVSFLFSGPRLYPLLRWPLVFATPLVVTVIATLASIYAARHAAQIKPAEAMQEKE